MRSRFPAVAFRVAAGAVAVSLAAVAHADPAASPEANPPGPVMAQGLGHPGGAQPGASGQPPITPTTPDEKAVQDLLGRAADDVTAGGKSADLITLLARHDRDRMTAAGDWSDVDRAAEAFRNAWQARFGISFTIADKTSIVMTEPNVHVTGVEPPPGPPSTQPTHTRKTALTLALTGPSRVTTATVRLANEGTDKVDWRFDLPDSVTVAKLHETLLANLTGTTAAQGQWPTDVDQAYLYVTQHVLATFGSVTPNGK